MVTLTQPWSAKHKSMTKHGSLPYNLSNSFAQPLNGSGELLKLASERGDHDLVKAYQSHSLYYTPNGGSSDLRSEISNLYGEEIQKDNIIVFAGAQVALQTAAFCICGNNDNNNSSHSIVFTPGYQSLQETPLHAGSQVTKIELSAKTNWQIDPALVEDAIQENTQYLVINMPGNPSGTLMAPETQQRLIQICEKHGIYILCDEVYRLLEHDERDRLPAMCDAYHRGLSCVTLSKPWGACGITIGWLAFQNIALRQRLLDVQYFGTACPSRASELLAIMTLRASDEILSRNMAIIRANLKLIDQFMQDYSDWFEWVRPKAGAICCIKFKGPLSTEDMGNQLAEQGIAIKPAYCFAESITEENDYFRVGYGEEVMPLALEKLREFVDARKGEWII